MAAGGWLVGVTIIANLARFWKNAKHAIFGIVTAYVGLVTIQYWGGAVSAAHTGELEPVPDRQLVGVGNPGLAGTLVRRPVHGPGGHLRLGPGVFGATDSHGQKPGVHAPAVDHRRRRRRLHRELPRARPDRTLVGAVPLLGRRPESPITVILDYWAFPARRLLYERADGADMNLNPAAFAAWIGRFPHRVLRRRQRDPSAACCHSMSAAGLIYYVWMKTALAKGTTPEAQLFGAKNATEAA